MISENFGNDTTIGAEVAKDYKYLSAESTRKSGENGVSQSNANTALQVITRFMCKFCGMQFIRQPDMEAHASHHDEDKPPLTCGVCGKVYNTRSKLQRHVRVHSGERPFPCVVCGKRFPRSDHVKQHMRVHAKFPDQLQSTLNPLGLTHKRYCRLCGVKFEHKFELNEHLLTHGFNKLFSCICCSEVFDSNEKLKAHKITHETQLDEYLPVLSVPDPSMSSKSNLFLSKNSSKKRRPGRPKGSGGTNKSSKDMSRLGFSKFKLARHSDSKSWQAVGIVLKTEEAVSQRKSVPVCDRSTPILEQSLKEKDCVVVKSEEEIRDINSVNMNDNTDIPQMSISACYSLAEGQDNSNIPDIDEIRASTLSDRINMIVFPMVNDILERSENVSEPSHGSEGLVKEPQEADSSRAAICTVASFKTVPEEKQPQTSFIKPSVSPTSTTPTATLTTLQQQVHPQFASITPTSTTSTASVSAVTTVTTRPTISLLPSVLAFRTHPILTTPALNLASTTVHPTVAAAAIYNSASHHVSFPAAVSSLQHGLTCPAENFPLGRKMMRCQYCCIWFEDSALGLLHQSLHSADETDPFTCKKCMKHLGNRLEFTAHIIWHLDPTMEDSAVA